MSKAFETVKIHTLIDKLHTQHSGTIHLQNANSNLVFHKVASCHPYSSPSTLQTSHCHQPQYNLPHTRMTTITAPHADINTAKVNIQPYLQDILKWTNDNDLLLYTDKMTCTLLTPDPAEYRTQLGLQIDTTHDHTPKNTRTHI